MRARSALLRQMQQFFETYLMGTIRWDEVTHAEAIPVDKLKPGVTRKEWRERGQFGKHREIVTVMFGRFTLTMESPSEAPPLGRITLFAPAGELVSGPIDEATWFKVAKEVNLPPPHEETKSWHRALQPTIN